MLSEKFREVVEDLREERYSIALAKLKLINASGNKSSEALYKHLESRLKAESITVDMMPTSSGASEFFSQNESCNSFIIVTPVYNCREYINETIQSIISQKGSFDIWYHIQDGGSTDGTLDVLREWEEKLKQLGKSKAPQIHYSWATEEDQGMYDAITKGFDFLISKIKIKDDSKFIATWINADDMLSSNALLTVDVFLSTGSDFSWLTGIGSTIDENGAITAVHDSPLAFSKCMLQHGLYDGRRHPSFVAQEGTFWKLSLWQQVKGLNRLMRYAGDWELWRQFAAITPLIKIEAVLAFHRRHDDQLSNNMDAYYSEIDENVLHADLANLELEETGYRGVYDYSLSRWNAVQAETGALLVKEMQLPCAEKKHSQIMIDKYPANAPNGKPWPKISVVTPSYNQGKYIGETIESVLSQGYPNLQYIIIDGGSTDETLDVVKKYQDHINYFVSEQDNGQSHAINKGFDKAEGEILTWLNSDDQYAPNALFSMALAFEITNADLVAGICEVYENNKLIHRHMTSCENGELPMDEILDLDTGWNGGQFFYQPEVFFKRTLWEKAGAHVREDCFYSMDYELWCRFAAVKAILHVIGKPIVYFRSHSEQKTANPAKFKAELKVVKENFIREWGVESRPTNRPKLDWGRHLRVAMVNDLGYKYGAGIAHMRIAASFQMAGHEVRSFELQSYITSSVEMAEVHLAGDVKDYCPDLIIFGNMHSATKDSISLVSKLEKTQPVFWLTHDLWLFTGRCAYVGDCDKYKEGCDANCPTSGEYPDLFPAKISAAWQNKRKLLSESKRLTLLANSNWALGFVKDTLSNFDNRVHVDQIKLGIPANIFKPGDAQQARENLGVTEGNFAIAFSVSSLSEDRKGGLFLIEALRSLNLLNITVILIGHLDKQFPVSDIELISLGYVDNVDLLVQALNAADVFVGPSSMETFGQVFMEAAMCGTPSVGFDVTGVKDAIVDGVTGIRVEEMTSSALANALASLYNQREFTVELGRLAHIYASSEYSIEACYRSFYNIFNNLGLVDAWELPHKIGFLKEAELLSSSESGWFALNGISPQEGPYLEMGIAERFHWCHGQEIVFNVKLIENASQIIVKYSNSMIDQLVVDVYLHNGHVDTISLQRTSNTIEEFTINFNSSRKEFSSIKLVPNRFLQASGNENRDLVFKLFDVKSI